MSKKHKFNLVSCGVLLAPVVALACACSDENHPTAQNSTLPAKVASAAPTPTIAPPPSPSVANVIAAANSPPPALEAAIPADAVASDASARTTPGATASVDTADLSPAARAINQAGFAALHGRRPTDYDPALVRLEVLLDRAGFSSGVIDGRTGTNLKRAIAAYAQAHGLASNGAPNPQLLSQLAGADTAPVMQAYRISTDDEAGPFIGTPPKNYEALARLPALSYSSPEQELAERFHMSQELLEALNPTADFRRAGTLIVVTAPGAPHDYDASRIVVDKTNNEVRAFDDSGQLAAVYPATVGSTERPAPSGRFAVVAVAKHPAYYYDPSRLTFSPSGAKGKLRIAPGPNNPVGSTWISLSIPTYGIHGSPDPMMIGKQQSHGCVRLTNWDAAELAKAVKKGVSVDFVGTETTKPPRKRSA